MSIFVWEDGAQLDRLMNEYMSLNFLITVNSAVAASLLSEKSTIANPLLPTTVSRKEMVAQYEWSRVNRSVMRRLEHVAAADLQTASQR